MKTNAKRILISALAATMLEAGFVGLASVTQQTSDGQDFFTLCLMPCYFVAAILTHNAEDTSIVLIYALMFMFLLGAAYFAQVIWVQIRKGSHVT